MVRVGDVVRESETQSERVTVVTGAAGGIGSAICKRLAESGASVVMLYRSNQVVAQALCDTLPGSGHIIVQADVLESDSLERAARLIEARFGKLDLLVNNAGVTRPVAHDDLAALDDELIDTIFRTNWRGAFASARVFQPLLELGSDTSVIVNISSVAAQTGLGSNVAYCASKAALDSMTRSLARALAPKIRVVSVSPGWVLGEYASRIDPALLEVQRERTPLRKLASAEDVAEAVYSAFAHLKHSTGCIIPVDGGRPLGQ
jgi:3-oxoacyl-[acyl-carrier protein] reductase